MVVLSVGMRKSGSGWYFNMTNELLIACGGQNIHEMGHQRILRPIIKGNSTVGRLNLPTLSRLALAPAHLFTVKTHDGPTPSLRVLVALGQAKVTYTYRDPRDVVLSTLDHAQAARNVGMKIDITHITSLEEAITLVKRELARWERWMDFSDVLKVKYEDVVADTEGELRRLADYLSLDVSDEIIQRIEAKYHKEAYSKTIDQPIVGNKLHLNKGIPGRFEQELSAEGIALCEQHLGSYIRKMGYA